MLLIVMIFRDNRAEKHGLAYPGSSQKNGYLQPVATYNHSVLAVLPGAAGLVRRSPADERAGAGYAGFQEPAVDEQPAHSRNPCIYPLLEPYLIAVLSGLGGEVMLLVQIKQLFPVMGRQLVPLVDSRIKTIFLGIAHRIHKGLDRKVVADGTALDRASRSADIDGISVSVCSSDRESDLAPAKGRKINLGGETKGGTVAVGITDVNKRSVLVKGQGFEPHPVVPGAERTYLGIEQDIQIPRLLIYDPVAAGDLARVLRRLILFGAEIEGQQPGARLFPGGAGLDIGGQGDDIAPGCRNLEHIDNTAEGIREDSINIHMHSAVLLKRFQIKRLAEIACL